MAVAQLKSSMGHRLVVKWLIMIVMIKPCASMCNVNLPIYAMNRISNTLKHKENKCKTIINKNHSHTHTHTHIYIYIHIDNVPQLEIRHVVLVWLGLRISPMDVRSPVWNPQGGFSSTQNKEKTVFEEWSFHEVSRNHEAPFVFSSIVMEFIIFCSCKLIISIWFLKSGLSPWAGNSGPGNFCDSVDSILLARSYTLFVWAICPNTVNERQLQIMLFSLMTDDMIYTYLSIYLFNMSVVVPVFCQDLCCNPLQTDDFEEVRHLGRGAYGEVLPHGS